MQDCDGVRDRKRADTSRRIHEAAVELALRDGLTAATVSDIAERADISRRTFFNYYPSKEDAVLGIQEPKIPRQALETFLRPPAPDDEARRDRVLQAVHLTMATMASVGPRTSPQVRRIVTAHPELVDRVRAHRMATQDVLMSVLSERLADQDATPTAADSARALVLLSTAVLRFAFDDEPPLFDDPDPGVIEKALTAFRTALKEVR
ncbi:MAG: TetR/AcrR family transcriptional regulator [Gordonia sp. (in: high G+C Gram-positive bacteria)]|uniref:TetR/AcrR family transcriptional regulator n=1 Tax=Gordonia sp. (in: high G+C Gram-positive bacteria) TaxID=84139 RepID=UPI0039E3FE2C